MTTQYQSFGLYLSFILMLSFSCEQVLAVDQYVPETQIIPVNKEEQTLNTPTDSLKYCFTQNKIGVGGYDVISYFEKNIAEKGSSTHQYTYEGVIYNFTSREHKEVFIKDVEKYLPAFGGWCSMTLAMGRATTPTYDNFKIINGKLYLFEKTLSINGRTLWIQNPEGNKQTANKNYLDYLDDGVINPTKD